MLVIGFVAGLWGLIELGGIPERMKSSIETEYSHSFAKDFEEDYFNIVDEIKDDLTRRGPPRPPIALPPNS